MDRQEILKMIHAKIQELNGGDDLSSADSRLVGRNAILTSIQLVNLIVDLESELSSRGYEIELASEEAMSSSRSPFRSIDSLAEYIEQSLES